MIARYGGLRKATIIVRDDGKLDVIRERETMGETFRGLDNLDDAFATIRAHGAPMHLDSGGDKP